MKNLILLLLFIIPLTVFSQDFKFRGKSKKTETKVYHIGEDQPFEQQENDKKVEVQFDGTQLTIGKETFKYIWHQNSRDMETVQLNCIERVEDGDYSYINARFEIVFLDSDHLQITRFKSESPTNEARITYAVDIIKTTN